MRIYADRCSERLICVDSEADPAFWDRLWAGRALPNPRRSAAEFVRVTRRYLPQGAHILEGGCGLGDKVAALELAGYKASGLDFAEKTVDYVKRKMPHLDIRVGDVRVLPFNEDTFDGYWSLGVIEHFWDGYEKILLEALRVLRSGGYLFLTFPSVSPLRLRRYRHNQYPVQETTDHPAPEGFYQFMLNPQSVVADLQRLGFDVCRVRRRSAGKGIDDDLPRLGALLKRMRARCPYVLCGATRFFLEGILRPWCSHSTLIVARKVKGSEKTV